MQQYSECNGMLYTVKAGDTLYGISRRFGVPLAVILRANPEVEVYNLRIGMQLCIPSVYLERPWDRPNYGNNCDCENSRK